MSKAIERLIQEPILICVVSWFYNWGTYYNPLIIWDDSLTKGILAVSLLEDPIAGSSLCYEEAERGVLEDRRVVVCLGVDSILKIA